MRTLAAGALLVAVIALAVYAVRQQQAANREILSRLGDVQAALREQTTRAGDLADQVTALAERVGRLEADNRDLRRQVAMLRRRKPAEIASVVLPRPLEGIPIALLAAPSVAIAEPIVLETIPITWATDWSSYQPAGIVAPAPGIVLKRRLTNPEFVRKLYYGYAALQMTDAATTLVSVNRGAREANPLLQSAAGSPAAMIGIKAATIAGTILTLEKVRKANPVVATASLIAINATLAIVAVNNVSVVTRQPPR
jgi:hypothetical protein